MVPQRALLWWYSSASRQAAITYCCGSTCWKVRVWVPKECHSNAQCFSHPLTAFFASLHSMAVPGVCAIHSIHAFGYSTARSPVSKATFYLLSSVCPPSLWVDLGVQESLLSSSLSAFLTIAQAWLSPAGYCLSLSPVSVWDSAVTCLRQA